MKKEPLCDPVHHQMLENIHPPTPQAPAGLPGSPTSDPDMDPNIIPSHKTVETQYEEIISEYAPSNINNETNPIASTSNSGEPVNPQTCRLCKKGEENEEWVGCEYVTKGKECDYCVHLACIGIKLNKGVNRKLFIKKFKYFCPIHV